MSSYALLLLPLLYAYFIDRCFGKPCENLFFEATDGHDTKYGTHDFARFICLRSLTTRSSFPILSPAIHRKPTEKFITIWIWAQSPLNNEPFSTKKKQETVLIPTNPLDWKAEWWHIYMRLDPESGKCKEGKPIFGAWKVKFETEKSSGDIPIDCVSIENFGTGEVKQVLTQRRVLQKKTLSDLEKAIDSDEGAPSKGHGKEIVKQLKEYIDSLFHIMRDIRSGELHETVMAEQVILTHPFHSRADGNKWIVAHYEHKSNIMKLPFIGKSKAAKQAAFSPEYIAKSGIELDTAVETNLKFGKLSEFGLPFMLTTAAAKEEYEIFWFQQIFGGCVLHSLKSALQRDGVKLLPEEFNKYATKIAKPCSYCGAAKPEIGPHSIYQKNIEHLEDKKHCRSYEYCGAEVYLMEHKYGLLQLNMKEINARMERTKSGLVEMAEEPQSADWLATINIFEQIMGGAFKKIFKSDIAPHILFVADDRHAWTYLKMKTLCDPDGYWLSLDSNNNGAQRIDIAEEIKTRLGKPGVDYTIYAVYPPKSPLLPKLHTIEDLWIPQKLKPATCELDQDTRNVFDYNALTDASIFPIYFLCFLLLSICLSLMTIAGCICGWKWGDDVLNKTLIQRPTRVTIHK